MALFHVIKQMNTKKLLDVHRLLRMNPEAEKVTAPYLSRSAMHKVPEVSTY
jgi:hypothetical protein